MTLNFSTTLNDVAIYKSTTFSLDKDLIENEDVEEISVEADTTYFYVEDYKDNDELDAQEMIEYLESVDYCFNESSDYCF